MMGKFQSLLSALNPFAASIALGEQAATEIALRKMQYEWAVQQERIAKRARRRKAAKSARRNRKLIAA